ncbi:MAG TPA: TlpA disulfide reductase family protein [Caulobacteraceae bacterium]
MNEVQAKARPGLIRWAMVGLALAGVAAVLYVIGAASFKPKQASDLSAYGTGALEKLVVTRPPTPMPDVAFTDANGKSLTLKDFRGQVVVLNLWATWCAPCKEEMPTLARLQAAYAAQPVSVVPLSVDRDEDLNLAVDQIASTPPLKLYRDPGYSMAFGLNPRAQGFPTTIIIDRQGRERARLSGAADWSSPEAKALIERLLRDG